MKPLPDKLSDDERALLRLAGELPTGTGPVDGSAALRDAFAALDDPLTLDAARMTLPPAGPAAHAVVRAMQDAVAVVPESPPRFSFRLPGWAVYPAAAAVLLGVAMVGWWYQVHDQYTKAPDPARVDYVEPSLMLPGEPDQNLDDRSEEQIVQQFNSMIIPDRVYGSELERQLAALKFLEESVQ